MADTTFVNGITLTDADWFNDLNRLHYTIAGDPATGAALMGTVISGLTADPSPVASTDYTVTYDASAATGKKVLLSVFPPYPLRSYIAGLSYDNGTDAVNDININIGMATDTTGVSVMVLAAALGKQSDVAWSVGGTTTVPAGGLDTGAVGNNDYYIWLIQRPDTGVVDALFSLSSTAPTMPTNYTLKRLIGWVRRSGGTIVAFTSYEIDGGGVEIAWNAPTLDVDVTNTLTTSRRTDAAKAPLNLSTLVNLNVAMNDGASNFNAQVCCPDQTDIAPTSNAAQLSTMRQPVTSEFFIFNLWVRTSAAGLVAARSNLATVDTYRFSTQGFKWARRV